MCCGLLWESLFVHLLLSLDFFLALHRIVWLIICWERLILWDVRMCLDIFEPPHDKTNRMACAPSEYSDQPGHPPSLISVFAVHMKKTWVLRYPSSAQRRLITGRMPRLIWVFAGRTVILLVLSWGGSIDAVLGVFVFVPFGVLWEMWNMIVSVPDHCLFYSLFNMAISSIGTR